MHERGVVPVPVGPLSCGATRRSGFAKSISFAADERSCTLITLAHWT